MRAKRFLAGLLAVVMLLSLCVTTTVAAGTDYTAGLTVTKVDDNKLSVSCDAGPADASVTIQGAQTFIVAFDLTVLKPLLKNGTTEATITTTPASVAMPSYKWENPTTLNEWEVKIYAYKSADGNTGFLIIQPGNEETATLSSTVSLAKFYLGFQTGKTYADVTKDTIRFATSDELKDMASDKALKFNDGNATYAWSNGGTGDTLTITPTVTASGFDFAIPAPPHEHAWDTSVWSGDATHHWHNCTADGCTAADSEKNGYDVHNYNQERTDAKYLKTAGNCKTPAEYYKSCICGAFVKDDANIFTVKVDTPHTGTEVWESKDANTHVQKWSCCGKIVTEENHTPGADGVCTKCNAGCAHADLTMTVAKPASCTEDGNNAYWICNVCHKVFKDNSGSADLTQETTVEAETLAKSHDFEANVPEKPATCETAGTKAYRHCKACDKNFEINSDNEIIDINSPPLNHSVIKFNQVDADCENTGTKEHWVCQRPGCGAKFWDKDMTQKIENANELIISASTTHAALELKHDSNNHWYNCTKCGAIEINKEAHDKAAQEATCKKLNKCSVCGQEWGTLDSSKHENAEAEWVQTATKHKKVWKCCDAVVVNETAHSWNENGKCTECGYQCIHIGGNATCETKAVCDNCGKSYGDYADHKLTHHPAVAATCVAKGNVEYWSCSDCNKNYNSATGGNVVAKIETAIDSNNHTGKNHLVAKGNGTHDVVCECGTVIRNEACSGGTASCTEKAECSVCHQKYGDLAAHTYTKGQYKTVETKGSIKVERLICDVCGNTAIEGTTEHPLYRASISLDMILKVVKASDGTNAVPAGKVFGYTITTEPTIAGLPTAFNFAATKGGDETITQAHLFACSDKEDAEAIKALKDLLGRTWTIKQTTASADGWTVDGTVYTLTFAVTDQNVVTPTITKVVKETKTEIDPATNKVQSIEFTNTYKSTSTTPGGNGGTGGGFPFKDSNKTNNTGKVESQKTFDGGIALYVGLSVLSLTGSALVIRKKKEF